MQVPCQPSLLGGLCGCAPLEPQPPAMCQEPSFSCISLPSPCSPSPQLPPAQPHSSDLIAHRSRATGAPSVKPARRPVTSAAGAAQGSLCQGLGKWSPVTAAGELPLSACSPLRRTGCILYAVPHSPRLCISHPPSSLTVQVGNLTLSSKDTACTMKMLSKKKERKRKTLLAINVIEGGKGPQAKACRQPLEAGRARKQVS